MVYAVGWCCQSNTDKDDCCWPLPCHVLHTVDFVKKRYWNVIVSHSSSIQSFVKYCVVYVVLIWTWLLSCFLSRMLTDCPCPGDPRSAGTHAEQLHGDRSVGQENVGTEWSGLVWFHFGTHSVIQHCWSYNSMWNTLSYSRLFCACMYPRIK